MEQLLPMKTVCVTESGSHQNVCLAPLPCSQPQSLLLASRRLRFPASFGPLLLCPEGRPGPCHSSVAARAFPAREDRDQSGQPIRAVWDAGHTRAGPQMLGEMRKASWKWGCLCHVLKGMRKGGLFQTEIM